MSAAVAPPASRNAPCPCGSGRRYKECHGRQAATAGEIAAAPTGSLVARMHAALAAQRAGRYDEAIAGYDEVIRVAPATFDAWHMRGVAQFQSHRFDEAEADIRRALALCPELPMGKSNLALVEDGRRMARAEVTVSRAAWPRFRHLVVDPAEVPLDGVAPGMRCFVIDVGVAPDRAARLRDDAAKRGASVHAMGVGADGTLGDDDEATLAGTGPGDVIVAVGCRFPLRDWTIACRPRAVALVVDGTLLAPVQDRLRELSGQRRRRVRLALVHDASVDLDPLPHARLAP